ncbi:DUF294 nucleotidyltransferase-like domain-containing protein [Orrella marina]|uniref:Nucleotidyltransferase n=1 Tax=Orrella marina TaxID=2163011 RepID=A0A2R4XNR2_9BURK|nr:DUF294 nucleotidyltransferase-like domain-containing protein [Orrella marina]AWB35425.1 nucleotidyltransferase [Orrella marina]
MTEQGTPENRGQDDFQESGRVVSDSLVTGLARQLMTVLPFSEMPVADVQQFLDLSEEYYYEPDEVILDPDSGVPRFLFLIRQGIVAGERVGQSGEVVHFELEAGDMFSVGAVLTRRAVSTTYRALGDCFCLQFPADRLHEFGIRSPSFMSFLQNHFRAILEQSHKDLQQHFAARAAEAQMHQKQIGNLVQRKPFTVSPDTALGEALRQMDELGVGSILIVDQDDRLRGILTRHDLLKRVVLPQTPLDTPMHAVMTPDPKTLDAQSSVEEAAQLMVHAGIRHIPVTDHGKVAGLVSERDLFTLQRFSVGNISAAIKAAHDMPDLRNVAMHIEAYSRSLLGQGVTGRRFTSLVSYLNDLLTQRIIELVAHHHDVNSKDYCWLALGSEGREEQTVATDQDNALVLVDGVDDARKENYLKFARAVNEALASCGFPLCKGNVMASNPAYCRTQSDWVQQADRWIDTGSAQALLQSSIFFDFRALYGNQALVTPLADFLREASATSRFISQMAVNAMNWKVPLTLFGGLDTEKVDGREVIDLKKNGIALIVDFARIYALAHHIEVRNTALRLEAVARALGYDDQKLADWVGSLEFLQTLRLRAQLQASPPGGNRNALDVGTLTKVDKVILKASLNVTRSMQQRLSLDYVR